MVLLYDAHGLGKIDYIYVKSQELKIGLIRWGRYAVLREGGCAGVGKKKSSSLDLDWGQIKIRLGLEVRLWLGLNVHREFIV